MATSEIVLYSCIINGRDKLKPIEVDDGFRYVVFSDTTNLDGTGWEIRRPVWTSPDPWRTARFHKHHPFVLFPRAEYAIWLDMTHWPYQSLQPLLTEADISLHRHTDRDTMAAEAEVCARANLDTPYLLRSQAAYYLRDGFPDKEGLFVTSCLVMRNTQTCRTLSEMWWEEICHWSKRDQVSLPYCLWRLGMRPTLIPGVERGGYSPYFKFVSHYRAGVTNFEYLGFQTDRSAWSLTHSNLRSNLNSPL